MSKYKVIGMNLNVNEQDENNDLDIYNHIEKLRGNNVNTTQYLQSLVRKDMNENDDNELERKIKRIVENCLKNANVSIDEVQEINIDIDRKNSIFKISKGL